MKHLSQHESPPEVVLILLPEASLWGAAWYTSQHPQPSFFKQKGPHSLRPSSESRAPQHSWCVGGGGKWVPPAAGS